MLSFTCFAAVDSGVFGRDDLRDTGTIIDTAGPDYRAPETWFSQWFCRVETETGEKIASEDLPQISSTRIMNVAMGAPLELFTPPVDTRVTSMEMWVQVYDGFSGERLRPYGSTLKAITLKLRYADDW